MNTSRQPFRTTLKQVKLKVNMKKATMPALTSMVKLKVSMKEATLTVASTSTSKSTILQVVLEAKAISAMTLKMEEWVLEVFIILEAVMAIDHLGPRLGESMSLTLKMEEASKLMPMKIKMEETMDGWMEETMAMKMKMETSKLMAMKMKLERSKLMAMKMKMETSKLMAMKMKMESKRKLRMKKALIGQIGTSTTILKVMKRKVRMEKASGTRTGTSKKPESSRK